MDLLLDAGDRLMTGLRRRFPVLALALAVLLWLLVEAFWVFGSAVTHTWGLAVLLTVPAVALAIVVARRGLRGTPWYAWGPGTSWIFLFTGVMVPLTVATLDQNGWVFALIAFGYGQVYFAVLAALDHLWIMRHGGAEPVDAARFRLRRQLQARLLLATLVAVGSIAGAATNDPYRGADYTYDPMLPFGLMVCCFLPLILFAVWFRRRPLAWASGGVIAMVYLLNLIPGTPQSRGAAVLQYGWVVLVAVYLWAKAARVWYWPMAPGVLPPGPRDRLPYPERPHAG